MHYLVFKNPSPGEHFPLYKYLNWPALCFLLILIVKIVFAKTLPLICLLAVCVCVCVCACEFPQEKLRWRQPVSPSPPPPLSPPSPPPFNRSGPAVSAAWLPDWLPGRLLPWQGFRQDVLWQFFYFFYFFIYFFFMEVPWKCLEFELANPIVAQ